MNCYEVPRSVSADHIRVTIAGTDYEWGGGFGAILKSHEHGVTVGSTRMIAGVLFHVAYRQPRHWWQTPTLCWTIPNDAISPEWLRAFKVALFGAQS